MENNIYKYNKTLNLVSAASSLGNNLEVLFDRSTKTAQNIAVIHDGYINLISVTNDQAQARYIPCIENDSKPRHVDTAVTKVMWCYIKEEQYLLVASSLGLQIYDEEGHICKFSHSCLDLPDEIGNLARGLAVVQDEIICVGNSKGTIRLFHLEDDDGGMKLKELERKSAHEKSVIDIASTGNLLASSDDAGVVHIWQYDEKLSHVATCPTYTFPCTSLKIWRDYLITGYGSGHIRIFSIKDGKIITEVGAHARWITGIDVAPDTGLILSVAEDTFARVWKVHKETGMVEQNASVHVKDSLLMGGRFLSYNGDQFCVTSYYKIEVHIYSK